MPPTRTQTIEHLTCTLLRWVNGRAVLRFEDGQEIQITRRFLPKIVNEGDTLEIHLHTPATAALHQTELARAILKEILGG